MISNLKNYLSKSELFQYLIEVFIFTDIWYVSYTFLLTSLNKYIPFVSHLSVLDQYRYQLAPEPFEIPVYVILTILMVLAISLYYLKFKNGLVKIFSFDKFLSVKLFVFLVVVIFFFSNLGSYPMRVDKINLLDSTTLNYLFLVIGITIVMSVSKYFDLTKRFVRYVSYSLAALIIGIVTLEPKFPMSLYDYSYILGPVYEIVNGKTIFTDIIAQYGFLTTLLLAGLHKLSIVNIFYLPVLIWVLCVVEYFLCFYLIYKLSKSVAFSIIGIFSIITVGYYSLMVVPFLAPQVGPLRWVPMILTVFIFYKLKRIESKMLIILVSFISLLMIDSGTVIILSYLSFLLAMFLKGQISFKKALKTAIYFFISLIFAYLTIDSINLLFGFKNINILSYLIKVNQYAHEGIGMVPIGNLNYFWLVILACLGSIVYFFRKKYIEKTDELILLSANIAIFGSIYFVGRSHPHNLFHISVLVLLSFFLLTGNALRNIKNKKIRFLMFLFMFTFFIAFPAYNRQAALATIVNTNLGNLHYKNIFTPKPFRYDGELVRKGCKSYQYLYS